MTKRNDIINVEIKDILFPNKGVGVYGDYKAVVKNTLPGQNVSVRVKKKRNGILECILLNVLEKSQKEIDSVCPHFDSCGGCSYQNIPIEYELEIKKNQVIKLLKDEGIEDFKFDGIFCPDNIMGYRNKCEFSFGDEEKGGSLALGMRKRNSFYEVVTLTDCNIIDDDYIKIISCVLKFFQKNNTSFYHKLRHEGTLRHLVVRKGFYTGEILINLVTSSEITFDINEFMKSIVNLKLSGKVCGILHTINDSVADVVKSDETKVIYGRDYFMEKLLGLDFKISAFSFFQTNTKGAELLYSIVKKYAGNTKDKIIFDLYCGTGTISQIMSEGSKKVIGIEIVEEAVLAAKENASLNKILNCEFIAGDVLKKVDELLERPDIIIVDPPREGINPKAIEKIIKFNADEIIYISCKPTSLAKDLKVFLQNGYKILNVSCIGQFPRSVHVETVVKMQLI